MSEQTINSFSKGMVKDISDTLRSPESYEDAHDIKIRGLEGSTDYIVSNIKGNELMFTIPDVPQIAKLTTRGGDFPDSWNFPPQILVDGTTIVSANVSISQSSDGTIDNFFDQFEDSLKTDPAFAPYNLIVKRIGSTIRVWSESYSIDLNTGTYPTALPTFFSSYPNVVIDTQVAQTTQQIIGWTTVGDNIYFYSTNTGSGGVASIWKLTYDEVTLASTVTLMYSEDLNMGTLNPIANPGGIESIFENTQTERLYWTDRINPLRTINIVDENAMCFAPEDLDLRLTSNLQKPTLLSVQNGGALVTGVYQVAYNLRNLDGATTAYSHTSNVIDIIDAEYSGYANITGNDSGELTSKSFTISIEDLDTTYSFLDLVVLRKETDASTAVISKINDIPITSTEFQYTVTGNEPASNITEVAFNRIAIFFEKCHAIAQKDNILFAANTEERTFDVEFDARAYRFDKDQNTLLADIQGNQEFYTSADLLSQQFYIPETADAINPLPTTSFRFQADGITLGGSGVNISYKFTQRPLSSDERDDLQSRKEWSYTWNLPFNLTVPDTNQYLNDGLTYGTQATFPNYKSPTSRHEFMGYRRGETYRFAWVPVKDGVEGFAKWIADIKMPEIFEANPNNEYDEDYNYLPHRYESNVTKWQIQALGVEFDVTIPQNVADQIDGFRIKRVKLEEKDRTILGQGILHASLQYFDNLNNGTPGTYHPIASVVENAQEWGLNAGLIGWQGTPSGYYNPWVQATDFTFTDGTTTDYYTQDIYSFHSPDFLFGSSPGTESGDYIKIVGGLTEWANTFDKDLGGGNAHTNGYKLYEYAPVNWHLSPNPEAYIPFNAITQGDTSVRKPVINGGLVGLGNSRSVGNKTYFNNSAPMQNYSDPGDSFKGCGSIGTDTFLVDLGDSIGRIPNITTDSTAGSGIPFSNRNVRVPLSTQEFYPYANDGTQIGRASNVGDKIVANYIRPRKAQYGGAGYAARSKNVYINTGCNIVMKGQTTFNNIKVFGGDTFVNIFDTYKMLRNFSQTAPEDWFGTALYYPVESNINTDLREGIHLSGEIGGLDYIYNGADPNPPAEDFPLDYGEDYKYNKMFSLTMDTQKSFPKPIGFEEITEHPHRIWASNTKTHGERIDAWRQFNNEKYIDIQGDLGEIRQLINRNGTLMAWQKYGFGIPSVNERAVINDQAGSGIILGQSGVLPRFDYVSQTIGSWHQFSFAVSPNGVMFFDSKDGAIYMYAQQGIMNITESKINNWLYANTRDNLLNYDAPYTSVLANIGGITSTYDYVNKEFLITIYNSKTDEGAPGGIIDNSYTLAYSEPLNSFVSYRSYKPIMYINDKKHIISPKPQLTLPITASELYIHEEGDRGVFYDNDPSESSITITVNKEPYVTKIFDNIRWFTEVFNPNGTEASDETFSEAEIYNTYQTTGVRTVFKRLMREWKHTITYAQNSKNRIRSHYVKQKFKFLNNNNKEFRLHYIMNLFRRILK